MIGPSVATSLISLSVRAVMAANYGKLHDRSTWIFNGTALLVSFVVKAYFSWSVRDQKPTDGQGKDKLTIAIQMKELGLMAASQIAGHLVGVVALNILGQSLARDKALEYTVCAGVLSDLVAVLDVYH